MFSTKELGAQATEVLQEYDGLRLAPTECGLVFRGRLSFSAESEGFSKVEDQYEIEISVPPRFPKALPTVRDRGSRIPKTFHTNPDGTLCLGSPVRQMLAIGRDGSILDFVEKVLVPYLYGYSYFERHGVVPFGELEHGLEGLVRDYATLFKVKTAKAVKEMISLAGKRKRIANKKPCACGSGRRLGKCHNRVVNRLRNQLGRAWFIAEEGKIRRNGWGYE